MARLPGFWWSPQTCEFEECCNVGWVSLNTPEGPDLVEFLSLWATQPRLAAKNFTGPKPSIGEETSCVDSASPTQPV